MGYSMRYILDANETHVLQREYMGKIYGYWFELVDIATGNVQILESKTKGTFDGATCDKFKMWCDNANIQPVPMYKKGVYEAHRDEYKATAH